MVLDRVQVRQLWDDGRFSGRNLYDGRTNDEGKPVSGSAMSEVTYGARGLLVYEAIERAIKRKIGEIYKAVGRPEAASVGRYHWETWVADSQQEASHGTLDAILAIRLSGSAMKNRQTMEQTGTQRNVKADPPRSKEEQKLLDYYVKTEGQAWTDEHANLIIKQARYMGNL
jgi:hypothetical protein